MCTNISCLFCRINNATCFSQKLQTGQNVSYMWEVGVTDIEDEQPLRLEFSMRFYCDSHSPEIYKYYVCLQRFKVYFTFDYSFVYIFSDY